MADYGQRTRLVFLLVYTVILFLTSRYALGSWLPPASEEGIWFYSGLVSLLLGNLITTPFFTKPADSISYAVAALSSVLPASVSSTIMDDRLAQILWFATVVYLLGIAVSGILSISLKDSRNSVCRRTAKSLAVLCDSLGTAQFVFSITFSFALIAFHRESMHEFLCIAAAGAVVVMFRPLETLVRLGYRIWCIWSAREHGVERLGEVVGHQLPGVVLIRHEPTRSVEFGQPLGVRADDGKVGLAMALDYVGIVDELWLRALHVEMPPEERSELIARVSLSDPGDVITFAKGTGEIAFDGLHAAAWDRRADLIGLTAPETDVSRLRVEIVRTDLDLEVGRMLEAQVGARSVLYQLTNGLTKEEILQQKNTRGYVLADAKKIGSWNDTKQRFEVVNWVPRPNAPVFLVVSVPVRSDVNVGGISG